MASRPQLRMGVPGQYIYIYMYLYDMWHFTYLPLPSSVWYMTLVSERFVIESLLGPVSICRRKAGYIKWQKLLNSDYKCHNNCGGLLSSNMDLIVCQFWVYCLLYFINLLTIFGNGAKTLAKMKKECAELDFSIWISVWMFLVNLYLFELEVENANL